MLATVWLLDVLVVRYAEGVMEMAAREGARAGSTAETPVPACRAEAQAWLGGGLGGEMGSDVDVACSVDAGSVDVAVAGRFGAWLPGVPDWEVEVRSTAVREP